MVSAEFFDNQFCVISANVDFQLDSLMPRDVVQLCPSTTPGKTCLRYRLANWSMGFWVYDYRQHVVDRYAECLAMSPHIALAWYRTKAWINGPAAVGISLTSRDSAYFGTIVLLDTDVTPQSQLSFFKWEDMWPESNPVFSFDVDGGHLILTDEDHPAVMYPRTRFVLLNQDRHEMDNPIAAWRENMATVIKPFLEAAVVPNLQPALESA